MAIVSLDNIFYLSRDMTKPTKWVCNQRRLRSAWASTQSDQGLRCPHQETLGAELPIEHTAKTDQTGQMPRLIWVFAGRKVTSLVLSCRGSFYSNKMAIIMTRKILTRNDNVTLQINNEKKRGILSALNNIVLKDYEMCCSTIPVRVATCKKLPSMLCSFTALN